MDADGRPHTRFTHRFLDSAFGSARNDTFLAFPTRNFDLAPKPVIPTEGAERRFMLSSQPREQSDVSCCHPDRASGANEWRDLWVKFGRESGFGRVDVIAARPPPATAGAAARVGAGCRIQKRILYPGDWPLATGYWLLVTGRTGSWPSASICVICGFSAGDRARRRDQVWSAGR